MKLWRIAAETRKYAANDLSGGGAAANPGRWNDDKEPVVYCAPTIAIAVLETAAYVDDAGLPLNRYLIEIDVPDVLWAQREELDAAKLPATWSAIPAGRASVKIGSEWLSSLRSPILLVPSVIVPEERASFINPRHPEAAAISARVVRLFEYNRLLRS
ncbi:MAG: RES domain-containing protein [Hyphomicrobiaceae bacterium]|nr:MAG: RES domain-containing protein [Hyphomicrobiaceae bacterium]